MSNRHFISSIIIIAVFLLFNLISLIIIKWRFFSRCKSCRPAITQQLPSGIFPPRPHLKFKSNRNSCTSSFSKEGMLELETSRTFDSSISRFFYFWKVLLHRYMASLYKGHVASSLEYRIIIIIHSQLQHY